MKDYNSFDKTFDFILGIDRKNQSQDKKYTGLGIAIAVSVILSYEPVKTINFDKITLYIRFPKYQNGIAISLKIQGLNQIIDEMLQNKSLTFDSLKQKIEEEKSAIIKISKMKITIKLKIIF